MSESEGSAGKHEQQKRQSASTQKQGHSVPDVEVDPSVGGGPDRSANRGPSRSGGFGGGQWILLWFFITLGVACGNLLSNYITSLAVAYQLQVVTSDLAEGFERASDKARQEAQAAAERRQAEQRAQRRESDREQGLARQCRDWRAAHQDMDTYTTRTNMNKYCGAYREYIRTGRVSLD